MQQSYMLTIRDLFTVREGMLAGAHAVIAIMDGDTEVDRMSFSGLYRSPQGYCRSYTGRPGLTAQLVSGPESLNFIWDEKSADSHLPPIVWRRRLSNPPGRSPEEVDVHDGRADYTLSGPYSLGEGGKIEVINGKLLFTGGSFKVT